jgi:hypothetical protein
MRKPHVKWEKDEIELVRKTMDMRLSAIADLFPLRTKKEVSSMRYHLRTEVLRPNYADPLNLPYKPDPKYSSQLLMWS